MRGLGRVTDVLSQALFPVPAEAVQGLDPRTVKAMQRQGLMQLGLGMMAAKEQGAGLGAGLNFAFNQAQQDINQGLGQALISRRANREDERLEMYDRRMQNAELQQDADRQQERINRMRGEARYKEGIARDDLARIEDKRRYEERMALERAQAAGRDDGVNMQRITRPSGSGGLVQDFGWNPRNNSLTPIGEPYKPVTTFTGNPTAEERKAAVLGTRLEDSLRALNEINARDPSASKPGLLEKGLQSGGHETSANFLRSADRQQANSAQLDALDAALTLATGAAYTREQLLGLSTSYFPQPFDDPATVKAKEEKFNTIVKAARIAAGRAAPYIDQALGPQDAQPTTPGQPINDELSALMGKYLQ